MSSGRIYVWLLFDSRNCGALHSGHRNAGDWKRKTGCRQCWHTSGQDGRLCGVHRRYFENSSCLLVLLPAGGTGTGTYSVAVWRHRCDARAPVACMEARTRGRADSHRLHMACALFSYYRGAVLPGGSCGRTRNREKGSRRTVVCFAGNSGCIFAIRFAEWLWGSDCQRDSAVAVL